MDASILLLQLAVILGAARLLGLGLKYLGQPGVVGEIAAGIVLGPLVFGAMAPGMHARLFPPVSLPVLDGLAQLGLVLFMFVVGLELRLPSGARRELAPAATVALASVLVPLALGVGVGLITADRLAPAGVAAWPYALFLGCALAVTAFPVMARILRERGLSDSAPGRLALAAAALADVLAWLLIAVVIALAGNAGNPARVGLTLLGLAAFVIALLGILRPLIRWLMRHQARDGEPSATVLAALLIGLFLCAFCTRQLGVHPVFGAFLFGACLPRDDRLTATLTERVQHVTLLVLMPIFFALAGLSTSAGAFAGGQFHLLLLILAAAIAGKLVGATAGARLGGQPWRASLAVGALMNARGLMELIVIKVGLDIGVIGPEMFTMLLIMAVVTTMMTGPLLSVILPAASSGAAVLAMRPAVDNLSEKRADG